MNDTSTADHAEPLTLENVYRGLQALRERVEDLEDLRDLLCNSGPAERQLLLKSSRALPVGCS
jgi:hypothetical protein